MDALDPEYVERLRIRWRADWDHAEFARQQRERADGARLDED